MVLLKVEKFRSIDIFNPSEFLALCYTPEKERVADPDFEFVRDYAALNRAAVDAGMITARDQARYR